MSVAYDDFRLVSPLGGLFRYYTSDGTYWREALNAQARWANVEYHKRISKTVYDLAHRTVCKEGKAMSDKYNATEAIKADYLEGIISFVDAVYDLRKEEYTPAAAQKLVDEWIREKHNNGPRDK